MPATQTYFFAPLDYDPCPTLGRSGLFSVFLNTGKQSASIFVDGGMGGQPNGEFFPLFSFLHFRIFRGFSPIPII